MSQVYPAVTASFSSLSRPYSDSKCSSRTSLIRTVLPVSLLSCKNQLTRLAELTGVMVIPIQVQALLEDIAWITVPMRKQKNALQAALEIHSKIGKLSPVGSLFLFFPSLQIQGEGKAWFLQLGAHSDIHG